jgi:aminoglycoside phosphotransferase (APT) family kinase protein
MLNDGQIERLTAHLGKALECPSLLLSSLKRFHGGASRETYGFDLTSDGNSRGYVLRLDPADSLIDTDRKLEFAAYRSFAGTDVPVPNPVLLVEDTAVLGAPFFVMERIEGGEAAGPMDANAYGDTRAMIGPRFFELLGKIHARDPKTTPLVGVVDFPVAATCWRRELDHWETILVQSALEPQPIGLAAIRWLRRNPPPPAQRLAVVHGDYRNGNLLHDGKGNILAVLDWEMAHIGDPLEDLAWALDPLFALLDDTRAAGLVPRDDAINIWESASGLRFDQPAFLWWEMFATLKGLAIWVSSARSWASGGNSDPILAFSGWYTLSVANQVLARRLGGAA